MEAVARAHRHRRSSVRPATPASPRSPAAFRLIPANPTTCSASPNASSVDLTVVGPEVPLSRGIVDRFAAEAIGDRRPDRRLRRRSNRARRSRRTSWRGTRVPTAALPRSAIRPMRALPRDRTRRVRLSARDQGRRSGRRQRASSIADDRCGGRGGDSRRRWSTGDSARPASASCSRNFSSGQEASYFVLADGAAFMPLSSAQDHKRIFDDDRGPNTGGMGAFAPSPLDDDATSSGSVDRRRSCSPCSTAWQREGHPYRGFLYVRLDADGRRARR
mgnify:CR=1 FL=1